jgi:hypothetical protein
VPLLICGALAVSAALLAGCEPGSSHTSALTITPSFVDLRGNVTNATQTFTVTASTRGPLTDLSLPLKWRVSDPDLGTIGYPGGFSASYIITGGSGNNTVVAEDQYGAEGVASIVQ